MRIAYITFESPIDKSGVGKKICAQARHWRSCGHDVHHIVLRAPKKFTELPNIYFPVRKNTISPLISASLSWRSVRRCLETISPDIIYMRELLWWPGIYRILKGFTVVEEINSDAYQEIGMDRLGSIKRVLHRIDASRHSTYIAARIFVTHELKNKLSNTGEKNCVIGNGADFSPRSTRKEKSSKPQIIMTNSANHPWQGVDLMFDMAYRNDDYDFHLVGPFKFQDRPKNLQLHGIIDTEQLELLYETMDVGLSTLALHRKGMTEACPLKAREYSEHGIPIAAGCADTDLSGADYFLDLSPFRSNQDEWNLHFRSFVEKWRNTPYPYEDARKRLSNEIKERKRIGFMQSILADTA